MTHHGKIATFSENNSIFKQYVHNRVIFHSMYIKIFEDKE